MFIMAPCIKGDFNMDYILKKIRSSNAYTDVCHRILTKIWKQTSLVLIFILFTSYAMNDHDKGLPKIGFIQRTSKRIPSESFSPSTNAEEIVNLLKNVLALKGVNANRRWFNYVVTTKYILPSVIAQIRPPSIVSRLTGVDSVQEHEKLDIVLQKLRSIKNNDGLEPQQEIQLVSNTIRMPCGMCDKGIFSNIQTYLSQQENPSLLSVDELIRHSVNFVLTYYRFNDPVDEDISGLGRLNSIVILSLSHITGSDEENIHTLDQLINHVKNT